MNLLPNINISGEPLSLQAPFTFCGSLILRIEKEHKPYGYFDANVDVITFYYFCPGQYIFKCFSLPSIWIAKKFYSVIHKYNKNKEPVLTYEYDNGFRI